MSFQHETTLATPEATLAAGAALGRCLRGGELVALEGPLGAGKTLFVKGIAAGLEVPADEPVVSPTFVLMRLYEGRLRLCHIDAYRLGDGEELLDLGFEELREEGGTVVAVEWADRMGDALGEVAIRVELSYEEDGAGAPGRVLRGWVGDEKLGRVWVAGLRPGT